MAASRGLLAGASWASGLHVAGAGLAAAALVRPPQAAYALAAMVLVTTAIDARAWRRLVSPAYLAFAGVASLILAYGGDPGGPATRAAAIALVARAGIVVVTVGALAHTVSPAELAALTGRVSSPRLGLALGIALNSLDALRDTARDTWHALRLRGAGRAGPRVLLRLYAVTLLGAVLARADAVALAAASRGWDRGVATCAALPAPTRADHIVAVLAWLPALWALGLRLAGIG